MIYLDHASTSWPKPPEVWAAMQRFLQDVGANPGRSGYRQANEAERIRFDAREAVAELFGLRDPLRVVFTLNGTEALNLVIRGWLTPGSHVVTTGLEHNAVMRPLRLAERHGVRVSVVPCGADGTLSADTVAEHLEADTRLVVVNHASNVCGTVLPVREIAAAAHARGVPVLVDAAQTGGCWPIHVESDGIDLLAFTGHKGLLGPTGTGGLAIHPAFDVSALPPLVAGGTGSRSEHEEQPEFLPDRFEAGTPNIIGLAGLAAGVRYVLKRGVAAIRAHERRLTGMMLEGLAEIPGVRVFGPQEPERRTGVVSFTLAGWSCDQVAARLEEEAGVLCRPGLHCAPRAHRTLGTYPDGTVRFSLGPFTRESEVEQAVSAVAALAGKKPA